MEGEERCARFPWPASALERDQREGEGGGARPDPGKPAVVSLHPPRPALFRLRWKQIKKRK